MYSRYLFLFLVFSSNVFSAKVENPWYFGGGAGYGSTTWHALVPTAGNQNPATAMSTPIQVKEGGTLWNFGAGLELFPNFQIEFDYFDYPDARVYFDSESLYSFENENQTELQTTTYTFVLQGKFLVPWEDSPMRLFASAGASWLNRQDTVLSDQTISPSFGLGLNYQLHPNWMAEFGFIYTAGNGESELNPTDDYMPFLYGVFARIFFKFG